MPLSQKKDNFIDKAFTVMAELIVKAMPIDEQEKKAYIYYREGLAAQDRGDYSEALECYEESLRLEVNAIDRSETLKNMGIIYMSNGDEDRALETYLKSLEENPKQKLIYCDVEFLKWDAPPEVPNIDPSVKVRID